MRSVVLLTLFVITVVGATSQKVKFDSTLKIGKVGYRIYSSNKNPQKNQLGVTLIGFDDNGNGDINWQIKGRVVGSEIDDLNRDGFPDVLIYIKTDDAKEKLNIIALASEENKTVVPIVLPDIMEDTKLRQGYEGHDSFKLFNGMLVRKFPITVLDEGSNKSFITYRNIYYTVVKGEGRAWLFKAVRNYDVMKDE